MTVVAVAGALANKSGNGGEAWIRTSWVRGLARLGVDAWLVEEIDAATCTDNQGRSCEPAESIQVAWFGIMARRFGLEARAALWLRTGQSGQTGETGGSFGRTGPLGKTGRAPSPPLPVTGRATGPGSRRSVNRTKGCLAFKCITPN